MKKKSFLRTPIAFYQHILGNIIKTLFLIFLWWFVTGFFDHKWTGLWTNVRLCPGMLLESLPFLILFSLFSFVWQGLATLYLSHTSTKNNIIYRPSFWEYLNYNTITEVYYLVVLMFYIMLQYGILRKTMIAVLIFALVVVFAAFSEIKTSKNTLSDLLKKSTRVVSYLSTADFPTRSSTFQAVNPIKFKHFETHDINLFFTNIGNCNICPYWSLAQSCMPQGALIGNLLLIIDHNFSLLSERQMNHLLAIIDEYQKQNRQVLAIRKLILPQLFPLFPGLANIEKKLFSSSDDFLTSELRKRHIRLIFADANDAMTLHNYFSNSTVSYKQSSSLNEIIYQQLALLSQATSKAEYKYEFINSVVSGLQIDADMTDNFYNAMRMVEFIFHYRALCELVENPSKQKALPDSLISTMGYWMNLQSRGKKKYGGQTVIAYKQIYQLLKSKPYDGEKVNYSEICSLLTELRNRYIGHGTMAFSVSDEMFSWVLELILVIAQVFEQDSRILTTESVIFDHLPVFAGTLENMEPQSGLLFSYTEKGNINFEYLDYYQGSVFAKETKHYQLDYMGE